MGNHTETHAAGLYMYLKYDVERPHDDHDDAEDDHTELPQGEDDTSDEEEGAEVEVEEQQVVGDLVRGGDVVKHQGLFSELLLSGLPELGASHALHGVLDSIPQS